MEFIFSFTQYLQILLGAENTVATETLEKVLDLKEILQNIRS